VNWVLPIATVDIGPKIDCAGACLDTVPCRDHAVIVEWVPIFREVRGKSIGGDLNVDDEGSEQRWFEPVQSLHHGSVGYQPVCT
jgi:hypothetical protein